MTNYLIGSRVCKIGKWKDSPILGYGILDRFANILFVPEVDASIVLSVGQLTRSNCATTFNKNEVSVVMQNMKKLLRFKK